MLAQRVTLCPPSDLPSARARAGHSQLHRSKGKTTTQARNCLPLRLAEALVESTTRNQDRAVAQNCDTFDGKAKTQKSRSSSSTKPTKLQRARNEDREVSTRIRGFRGRRQRQETEEKRKGGEMQGPLPLPRQEGGLRGGGREDGAGVR